MNFDIRQRILLKLYNQKCWNEKHTAFENAYTGIPSHLKGLGRKELLLMIKENLILQKHTNYGLQVSLNSEKISEIKSYIKNLIF